MSRNKDNHSQPLREPNYNREYNDDQLAGAILRLSGTVLGLVLGILFSLIIFIATNWLVVKGGPIVGPHLGLLSQYFIGYSVSFIGSLVGVLYAFVFGYLSGLMIAWIYHRIVSMRMNKS